MFLWRSCWALANSQRLDVWSFMQASYVMFVCPSVPQPTALWRCSLLLLSHSWYSGFNSQSHMSQVEHFPARNEGSNGSSQVTSSRGSQRRKGRKNREPLIPPRPPKDVNIEQGCQSCCKMQQWAHSNHSKIIHLHHPKLYIFCTICILT